MKRLFLLNLSLLLLTLPSYGQQGIFASSGWYKNSNEASAFQRCATVERNRALRAANPALPTEEEFEHFIQRAMASRKTGTAGRTQAEQVLYLPVVVHIIHHGEEVGQGSNIPYSQVLSQIEVLNEDFRRRADTRGYNEHVAGADTYVEFVLAAIDPEGNKLPEPGLHRVMDTSLGVSGALSPEAIDATVKPATYWDPTRYFNIWTADLGENLLGYAQLPTNSGLEGVDYRAVDAAAETDGVVVLYNAFGSSDKGNFPLLTPYDKGRTATHEVGHWLGLRHIWGDGGCDADDFCSDTPASGGPNFGCPVGVISCSSADMIENYMDYTDDACMNIFTLEQKARMQTVLQNSPRRKELLSSDVISVEEVIADFTADKAEIREGEQVLFTDASLGTVSSWSWVFEGGIPATSTEQNPLVVYEQAGSYRVSLTVSNAHHTNELLMEQYLLVRDLDWMNTAPALVAEIENPLLQVGEVVILPLDALFYDADGHALRFSVSNENSGVLEAVLNESTLSLEGRSGGSSHLTLIAEDNMGGLLEVVLQVSVNTWPELIAAPGDQLLQVAEFKSLALGDYFSDPDGGQLTYTYSSEDEAVVKGLVAGSQLSLTGLRSGLTGVKIKADDGFGGSREMVFNVEVNQQPEVLQVPADQWLVLEQDTFRLKLSEMFIDAEGARLAFGLGLSTEGYLLYELEGEVFSFVTQQAGATNVTLQATDDKQGVSSVSFVIGGHRIPHESQPLREQEVRIGDTLSINLADYFADEDGHELTYAIASQTEGVAAGISESMLELTGLAIGEANVHVKVVDEKGGMYEKHLAVRVLEPLSVNRQLLPGKLLVHPNPFTNYIVLKVDGAVSGAYQLLLFDLQGRNIQLESRQQFEAKGQTVLNLEALPRGTYLLRLVGKEVSFRQRIVKQ